ncbi:hypothetical protein GUITHDRAFT_109973 [Guillardia theta CCMP2712]|uniref:Uncharacterized protein n=1 Tax=Guillardia theta (strain CCMP2712) TaxID=905079 RepID=L1J6M0_GUITC|nr:hypothetical protein GUITHDRAFT_109973 [Guillardia theta CCMP2712]EKX44188.1 hypothetical protein GUITHDRAFT_109973 [Guillardia theta CCMP2712]|eukprot:XP_005831168.1 hypothetical protein GUITHDRAFT_109973 [Guillardia theta CCMP2712]
MNHGHLEVNPKLDELMHRSDGETLGRHIDEASQLGSDLLRKSQAPRHGHSYHPEAVVVKAAHEYTKMVHRDLDYLATELQSEHHKTKDSLPLHERDHKSGHGHQHGHHNQEHQPTEHHHHHHHHHHHSSSHDHVSDRVGKVDSLCSRKIHVWTGHHQGGQQVATSSESVNFGEKPIELVDKFYYDRDDMVERLM